MKTLFIENAYLEGHSGVTYAAKAFVNLFAKVSEEMVLVYPDKNYKLDNMPSNVSLLPVVDKRCKIVKFLEYIFGVTHRYGKETIRLFDPNRFDVVVFDASPVSFRLIKKVKRAGLKAITIHHNYQIEYAKDDTRLLLKYPTLFWTRIFEREAVQNSDLNLTLTNKDATSLADNYGHDNRFEVIGVCEFTDSRNSISPNNNHTPTFIITGQLSSIQTEKPLIDWINNYYPTLKKCIEDSRLIIAGKNPSERLIALCKENGIIIIPSPKDMAPILNEGDFFICPTSMGSGLKLRVLDGLRCGLKVLCHERSARGFEELEKNGVVFSYDNLSSFREKLIAMINCDKGKEDVYSLYQKTFSQQAGQIRLTNILHKYGFI